MLRKIYLTLLLFILTLQQVSHADIINAEYHAQSGTLSILSKFNKDLQLNIISLANCSKVATIDVDDNATSFSMSKYFENFALIGTKELKLYNIVNGKVYQTISSFDRNITHISQSYDGAFIAVTDGASVELFTFKGSGLESVTRVELIGGVISIYPDFEQKKIYILENDGRISTWDFTGRLLKNFKIDKDIIEITHNDKLSEIIFVANDGLYSFNRDTSTVTPIISTSMTSATIDSNADMVVASNKQGVFAYNLLHDKHIINITNSGKILKSSGAKFVGLINRSIIRLFDLKVGTHIASVYVSDNGIMFLEPDTGIYSKGITGAAERLSGMPNIQDNNERIACATITALITGVYLPTTTNVADTNVANVEINDNTQVDDVSIPNIPDVPSIDAVADVAPVQIPIFESDVDEPTTPSVADNTKVPDVASVPDVAFKDPTSQMAEGSVPAWFANRGDLPTYNAVTNAVIQDVAVKSAKTQIKNEIVKQALTGYVTLPEANEIASIDVKKRFLWQAASRAANILDSEMKLKEVWISPANQQYVLVGIDNVDRVKEVIDKAYQEELALFKTKTPIEYLKIQANLID